MNIKIQRLNHVYVCIFSTAHILFPPFWITALATEETEQFRLISHIKTQLGSTSK